MDEGKVKYWGKKTEKWEHEFLILNVDQANLIAVSKGKLLYATDGKLSLDAQQNRSTLMKNYYFAVWFVFPQLFI